MTVALIVLFSASATLPVAGLVRLYRAARAASIERQAEVDRRGSVEATFGDFDAFVASWSAELLTEDRNARLVDLLLIGGGLICGASASIWDVLV
ncbi:MULTISPECIES: hypothetical protein [unclassified Curtobacterium]|uniref:hypothetical protein n=1 Tax=unclassified Curtobacterium TaxID=257496 RepID=UPI0011B5BA19|nr:MULTISPECIES: hypothetical protein [unclassified Curtobacterium]